MPENIILDTDMDTDCDDAGALALLHYYAGKGLLNISAVVCDVNNPWTGAYVKTVNSFLGRAYIPVGVWNGTFVRKEYTENQNKLLGMGGIYNRIIAERNNVIPGRNFFPEDSVRLYRRILASADDKSVTICAIGLLSVIAALLGSFPDEYSNLSGRELVKLKVKRLVTMGLGVYPKGKDRFNWKMDSRAAGLVLNKFPAPILVNALGEDVLSGNILMKERPDFDPVAEAFRIFSCGNREFKRPSWDQITVMAAAGQGQGFLFEKAGGKLSYDPVSEEHVWLEEPGCDSYLEELVPAVVIGAEIDRLMMTVLEG